MQFCRERKMIMIHWICKKCEIILCECLIYIIKLKNSKKKSLCKKLRDNRGGGCAC